MTNRIMALTILLFLLPLSGWAQSPSAFPVEVWAGKPPQPVMADGRVRLAYELHLTNISPSPIELKGLDVLGDDGAKPLAGYRDAALEPLLGQVGPEDGADKMRAVGGGRAVVIFIDLTLDAGAQAPKALHHRLTLTIAKKDGSILEKTVDAPVVPIVREPVMVLRSPLRGARWVAFNGLSNPVHRRSTIPVDGTVWIAQRFAIDWQSLGPNGLPFHGDAKSNANFYCYGADLLAVADGRVSDVKDGLPDNVGSYQDRAVPITLETIAGNYVMLDLGQGRFALYAHLQPGSLKVKVGDRVKAGQVLGLLGNSGNSDAPHLHFHLVDANVPLGAEGIPYVLDGFSQLGISPDPDAMDAGAAWKSEPGAASVAHRREFPVDRAVVTFP
jgi:murein DD-endopeptidase